MTSSPNNTENEITMRLMLLVDRSQARPTIWMPKKIHLVNPILVGSWLDGLHEGHVPRLEVRGEMPCWKWWWRTVPGRPGALAVPVLSHCVHSHEEEQPAQCRKVEAIDHELEWQACLLQLCSYDHHQSHEMLCKGTTSLMQMLIALRFISHDNLVTFWKSLKAISAMFISNCT